MSVLIVDFEDSFTYNIASEIKTYVTDKIIVKKWCKVNQSDFMNCQVVCLGPGPGHPFDYQDFISLLKQSQKTQQNYLFGICLGHQIIGTLLDYKIKPCSNPVHGIKQSYELTDSWQKKLNFSNSVLTVQHYNSWCLEAKRESEIEFSSQNQVLILKGEKFRSYQFHPESIATENRKEYFYFLQEML